MVADIRWTTAGLDYCRGKATYSNSKAQREAFEAICKDEASFKTDCAPSTNQQQLLEGLLGAGFFDLTGGDGGFNSAYERMFARNFRPQARECGPKLEKTSTTTNVPPLCCRAEELERDRFYV